MTKPVSGSSEVTLKIIDIRSPSDNPIDQAVPKLEEAQGISTKALQEIKAVNWKIVLSKIGTILAAAASGVVLGITCFGILSNPIGLAVGFGLLAVFGIGLLAVQKFGGAEALREVLMLSLVGFSGGLIGGLVGSVFAIGPLASPTVSPILRVSGSILIGIMSGTTAFLSVTL